MAYFIALLLVMTFTANVVVGAVGDGPIVGIVAEMLILVAAATSFSVGILLSEARAKANQSTKSK